MPRFALRIDANQPEIVRALRAAGAIVKVVHQPFDLQVWAYPGSNKTMYVEVKNMKTAYGKKGLNGKQTQEANGLPVAVVTDVDGALRALAVLRGLDE